MSNDEFPNISRRKFLKMGFTAAVVAIVAGIGGYLAYQSAQSSTTLTARPTLTESPTAKQSFPPATSVPVRTNFITSDRVKIVGDYWLPAKDAAPYSVVILIHQFGGSRRQWDFFVPTLLSQRFAVLTYDIRGFGESTRIATDGEDRPFVQSQSYLDDMTKDVEAAVRWLKNRPEVDVTRIGAVGASVGANIAYVASGSLPDIRTAVSLSPSFTGGPLMGRNIPNFSPHNVLFMSDDIEQDGAKKLLAQTREPKELKVYSGQAHGVLLLSKPNAVDDVLGWLKRNLQ